MYLAVIYMYYDKTSITVDEDVGSISPLLKLDKASPCCLTVLVELLDQTATGKFSVVVIETFYLLGDNHIHNLLCNLYCLGEQLKWYMNFITLKIFICYYYCNTFMVHKIVYSLHR